jgi:hypothetical protein
MSLPDNKSQHMLSTLGWRLLGFSSEQAGQQSDLTKHHVLHTPGYNYSFAPGGELLSVQIHPLPSPSSLACLSILAPRLPGFHCKDQQGLLVLPFAFLLEASHLHGTNHLSPFE